MSKKPNALHKELSPYLLQHAYNPVDWNPWNSAVLEKAKAQSKPLIISIGYASCHWCHVMERESFEDQEVAAYMNEHFFCIKVDREERPDVDQFYMTAANIITKRGGWPLNCFALPNGRPFHAGTYYPKEQWLRLLGKVNEQYRDQHESIENYAARLTEGIRMQETVITDEQERETEPEMLESYYTKWSARFDNKDGGMQGAPKFPMAGQLISISNYAQAVDGQSLHKFVKLSLDKMAQAGIHDQLLGGFARYATDLQWKIPHFEKMLYDNAQLLSLYSMAAKRYHNVYYRQVADSIIHWLGEEMKDDSGLYHSGIDADSQGKEGLFYTWSMDELKECLGEKVQQAVTIYGLGENSLWEGRHILERRKPADQLQEELKLRPNELSDLIETIEQQLLKKRAEKERPATDTKCLSSWNGMILSGFVEHYKQTGSTQSLVAAEDLAMALTKVQLHDNSIYHSHRNGSSYIDSLLEDHAFVATGLLELFMLNQEAHYYSTALRLFEQALELFYDQSKEVFYMHRANELAVRNVELHDNVIPSGNAVMATLSYKLGLMEARMDWILIAQRLLGRIQNNMLSFPQAHYAWADLLRMMRKDFVQLVVIGPDAKEYAEAIRELDRVQLWLMFSEIPLEVGPFKNRWSEGQNLIYPCQNGQCHQALNSMEQLMAYLEELKP